MSQDDKKPREFWVYFQHGNHCVAVDKLSAVKGAIHVIEKSAYDELAIELTLRLDELSDLARKLEAAARERDEWEIREQMARARNSKLVAALTAVAKNSCCEPCREAGLVAKQALEEN